MKLITGVVRPHVLDRVKEAVRAAGATGLTVTEAAGFGRQGGQTEMYRGAEYEIDFVSKSKVEVLAADELADAIASALESSARTDEIGDGKVWVTDVQEVRRVRTGERGSDAI